MKIVDVCAFYAPCGGGVRTYVDRKLVAGPAAGHDITIIAPGEANRVEQHGPRARVVWLENPRLAVDRSYRWFRDEAALHRAITAEAPDIVEASSPWRSASMVARWPGPARRVLIMHADPLAAFAYRWFEGLAGRETVDRGFDWYWRHLRRLDAAYDMVVSASAGLSQRLVDGGLRGVVTNPMGVDPGIFSPALRDPGLRASMLADCGLGPAATLLIGVGRHSPEKRWPLVIRAVAAAGRTRPIGLVIVGGGRDHASLGRLARRHPRVRLLPPVLDRGGIARLMASADALVHGSDSETFCIAAAEASASGLPLITPDRGAAADHARASGGLVYAAGSVASAANAIARFVDAGAVRNDFRRHPPRTMDCHFKALFTYYASLIEPLKEAA